LNSATKKLPCPEDIGREETLDSATEKLPCPEDKGREEKLDSATEKTTLPLRYREGGNIGFSN